MKEQKLDIDIADALEKDKSFQEGVNNYERFMEQSHRIADEITSSLISEIVKKTESGDKANELTLSGAVSGVAKVLVNLVSYLYDTEESLLQDIELSKKAVVEKVIPALLNPQPCGICPECKSKQVCKNPKIDDELLSSRLIPMISHSLIEYDMWNKIMYLHTVESE